MPLFLLHSSLANHRRRVDSLEASLFLRLERCALEQHLRELCHPQACILLWYQVRHQANQSWSNHQEADQRIGHPHLAVLRHLLVRQRSTVLAPVVRETSSFRLLYPHQKKVHIFPSSQGIVLRQASINHHRQRWLVLLVLPAMTQFSFRLRPQGVTAPVPVPIPGLPL